MRTDGQNLPFKSTRIILIGCLLFLALLAFAYSKRSEAFHKGASRVQLQRQDLLPPEVA